jgi:hypothetical protein
MPDVFLLWENEKIQSQVFDVLAIEVKGCFYGVGIMYIYNIF